MGRPKGWNGRAGVSPGPPLLTAAGASVPPASSRLAPLRGKGKRSAGSPLFTSACPTALDQTKGRMLKKTIRDESLTAKHALPDALPPPDRPTPTTYAACWIGQGAHAPVPQSRTRRRSPSLLSVKREVRRRHSWNPAERKMDLENSRDGKRKREKRSRPLLSPSPLPSPLLDNTGRHVFDRRPRALPSQRFQALLTPLPGSFSSFPHGTCPLSVSRLCSSLGWGPPPD